MTQLSDDEVWRLIEGVRPTLMRYALSLCRNQEAAAEDLLSEVSIKLFEERSRFEPGTNFPAWAVRVMRNHFLNQARRPKNKLHANIVDMVLPVPPSQERGLITIDMAKRLLLLPREIRRTILLSVFYGMGYDKIAELHGINVGTVKSRISRARSLLESTL